MSQIIPPDITELRGQPPQSDMHPHQHPINPNQPPRSAPDPNLDPKLSGDPSPIQSVQQSLQLNALDSTQILNLLRHLPGLVNKASEHGVATAEQLQALAAGVRPMPGPSSFQFTTTADSDLTGPAAVQSPTGVRPPDPHHPTFRLLTDTTVVQPPNGSGSNSILPLPPPPAKGTKRKRGGKPEDPEEEEDWARQRKDNHKEVERRRRGNINEGINELARIVPNGSGEKAKGAILNRAVQYIHHLKENEARNIEKWTLEKLLMDQAMGDMQAQLDEIRRLWEEERQAKERALIELDVIRSGGRLPPQAAPSSQPSGQTSNPGSGGPPSVAAPYDRAYHPSDRHLHSQDGKSRGEGKDGQGEPGAPHDPDGTTDSDVHEHVAAFVQSDEIIALGEGEREPKKRKA